MTEVMSMHLVKVKGQGHRVQNQLSCFRTITPFLIHIWRWNDLQSSMLLRRSALLFFKVIRQISRSHGLKNLWFESGMGFFRKKCISSRRPGRNWIIAISSCFVWKKMEGIGRNQNIKAKYLLSVKHYSYTRFILYMGWYQLITD